MSDRERLGALPTAPPAGVDSLGAQGGPSAAMPLAAMEKLAIRGRVAAGERLTSRAPPELLGVTRMQLYTRLKRFGLDR